MGALRARQRDAGSARLTSCLNTGEKGHERRSVELGQRVSCPRYTQGVQFRVERRSDPLPVEPGGDRPRDAARLARRSCALNEQRLGVVGDPEIATRINSFEMAFRMQASAPELMDLSQEPKATLDMYGAEPGKTSFANSCLLARRLVERGVRFVADFPRGLGPPRRPDARPEEELRETPTRHPPRWSRT